MLFYPLLIRPLKHLDFTSLFGFLRCACFWLGIGWKKSEQTSQPVATQGFSEGLAAVQKGERWGYIDTSGKEIIPATYYNVGNFQDGIAPVMFVMRPAFTYAYIDRNNEFAITPHLVCTEAYPFYYGANLALIRKVNNGVFKNGYVDKLGMISIPFIYDDAGVFREGYAPVEKNGKWGYIDEKGKVVIP